MNQDYRENLALAFDTLRTHKLRSFLAVLGVMIGVGLIILVVGLVDGFKTVIQDEITQEGIDTAWVQRYGENFNNNARRPKEERERLSQLVRRGPGRARGFTRTRPVMDSRASGTPPAASPEQQALF